MTSTMTEFVDPVPDDDPQPTAPDWDAIGRHLSDLSEVERQHTAALAALKDADNLTDRCLAVRAAPAARVRQAADRACALDTADLLEWGQWAAREIARCHRRLGRLHAALGESERERAGLLVRAQAAEALSVAQRAAVPDTGGPGVTAVPAGRHADGGQVAA